MSTMLSPVHTGESKFSFRVSPRIPEQRDFVRRTLKRDVWLVDLGGRNVVRCRTDEMSDAGFHATAPKVAALGVGQRYEIRMAYGSSVAAGFTPSLGYGTIRRTDRGPESATDRMGFAVRLDVPQLIQS